MITIDVNNPDGSLAARLTDQFIPSRGKFEIRPSDITGIFPTSGTITVSAVGGKIAGIMKYQYGTGLQSESYFIPDQHEVRKESLGASRRVLGSNLDDWFWTAGICVCMYNDVLPSCLDDLYASPIFEPGTREYIHPIVIVLLYYEEFCAAVFCF